MPCLTNATGIFDTFRVEAQGHAESEIRQARNIPQKTTKETSAKVDRLLALLFLKYGNAKDKGDAVDYATSLAIKDIENGDKRGKNDKVTA